MANDDHVDDMSLLMGRFRGALAALDLHAFSTWKLIQSLREENFPVTPSRAPAPPKKQSSSALLELIK